MSCPLQGQEQRSYGLSSPLFPLPGTCSFGSGTVSMPLGQSYDAWGHSLSQGQRRAVVGNRSWIWAPSTHLLNILFLPLTFPAPFLLSTSPMGTLVYTHHLSSRMLQKVQLTFYCIFNSSSFKKVHSKKKVITGGI